MSSRRYPDDWILDPDDDIYTGEWDVDMMYRRGILAQYIWNTQFREDDLVHEVVLDTNANSLKKLSKSYFAIGNKTRIPLSITWLQSKIRQVLHRRQKALRSQSESKVKPRGFERACLTKTMFWRLKYS